MTGLSCFFVWAVALPAPQEPGLDEVLRLTVAGADAESVELNADGSPARGGEHVLTRVQSIAFSRDSRYLAVGMPTSNAFIDLETGAVRYVRSPAVTSGALALAPGLTGPEVILVDPAGISLWNVAEGSRVHRYLETSPITGNHKAAVSPNGRMLALAEEFLGHGVCLVDLLTGVMRDEKWDVNDLVWRDDDLLATASGDHKYCLAIPGPIPPDSVRLHDAAGDVLAEALVGLPHGLSLLGEPETVSFIPTERTLLVGSIGGLTEVDAMNGAATRLHEDVCTWVRFVDRRRLVTADFKTLTLRDFPSLAPLDSFSLGEFISCEQVSPDGRKLAFTSGGYLVVLEIM